MLLDDRCDLQTMKYAVRYYCLLRLIPPQITDLEIATISPYYPDMTWLMALDDMRDPKLVEYAVGQYCFLRQILEQGTELEMARIRICSHPHTIEDDNIFLFWLLFIFMAALCKVNGC